MQLKPGFIRIKDRHRSPKIARRRRQDYEHNKGCYKHENELSYFSQQ